MSEATNVRCENRMLSVSIQAVQVRTPSNRAFPNRAANGRGQRQRVWRPRPLPPYARPKKGNPKLRLAHARAICNTNTTSKKVCRPPAPSAFRAPAAALSSAQTGFECPIVGNLSANDKD